MGRHTGNTYSTQDGILIRIEGIDENGIVTYTLPQHPDTQAEYMTAERLEQSIAANLLSIHSIQN